MENNIKEIKCKDCVFYSGVQCHGHGDYWAECNLLNDLRKLFSKLFNIYQYDLERKGSSSCWDNVIDENSNCMFFKVKE